MTTQTKIPAAARALSILLLSLVPALFVRAQATPVAPPNRAADPAAKPDEMITLSPFEVLADSDKSYGALNSNSITRFNTELDHMPVSADIFNEAFMKDVGAVSVEDMIMSFSAGAGNALATDR